MKIKTNTHLEITQEFVKSLNPNGVSFWRAYDIISKHYCSRMFVNGLCPHLCEQCAEGLKKEMDVAFADRPDGLLIWRMKRAQAVQKETPKPEYEPPEVDPFGLPAPETNPFTELAR
jgi:hypothetical protein